MPSTVHRQNIAEGILFKNISVSKDNEIEFFTRIAFFRSMA